VGFVDKELSRLAEPGTPGPERRLAICTALAGRGLRCGVLMGPVLPYLSDSPAQLAAAVAAAAQAGAASVTPIVLHLRPGTRDWYERWLAGHHPGLLPAYRELYGSGAYAPRAYQERISAQVRDLARRHGVGARAPAAARRAGQQQPAPAAPAPGPAGVQLALL
jgi:DNA repair photolyase